MYIKRILGIRFTSIDTFGAEGGNRMSMCLWLATQNKHWQTELIRRVDGPPNSYQREADYCD